jgi:TATA-binding protein-associated factor Taf7
LFSRFFDNFAAKETAKAEEGKKRDKNTTKENKKHARRFYKAVNEFQRIHHRRKRLLDEPLNPPLRPLISCIFAKTKR